MTPSVFVRPFEGFAIADKIGYSTLRMLTGIPTDNLYKFMAMAGLAMAAAAPYYSLRANSDYLACAQTHLQLLQDQQTTQLSLDSIKGELEIARKRSNESPSGSMQGLGQAGYAYEMFKRDTNTREIAHHEQEAEFFSKKFNIYNTTISASSKNVDLQDLIARNAWYFARAGVSVGLLLSCSGFILWYRKIQRHEDMITQSKSGQLSFSKMKKKHRVSKHPL